MQKRVKIPRCTIWCSRFKPECKNVYPIASLSEHPFVKEKVVVALVLGGGRGICSSCHGIMEAKAVSNHYS